MAYTVLARRYRSQSFGSVVGQEPIASTLINAINANRVAHAYLFCGTRGVGKTSMARIFARALNAPATVDDAPEAEGVDYPETDVQQRMAEAIMRGEDLNVIEIDGASNNSVEQARQLIANAGLSPTANALYKVYIIDEVHMLSPNAFNALLKTMEEPPSHVKFILCTTEPHKVPATIQSRCQRFDFRNIATAKIAEHLSDVLKNENVEAESEVVWQVARLGNGSMRDALSLMDRLLATGESPLTAKTLQDMLGLPDHELIAALVEAMANGDVKGSLVSTADLLGRGISQDQLVEVLIERLRQLMLIGVCGPDSELVELSEDAKAQAVEQAKRFDAAGLVHMIALCENLLRFGKASSNPRALLDATVVRLALAEKMADVSAVLSGGAAQKKKLAVSPAGTAANARPAPTNTPPRPSPASAPAAAAHAPRPAPATPSSVPPPSPSADDTPLIDSTDPRTVWQAVLKAAGQSNASAWMDHFVLSALEVGDDVARAVLMPTMSFAGGARNVATGPRLKRVADTMTKLLGKPTQLTLGERRSGREAAGAEPAGSGGPDVSHDTPGRGVDRRAALDLPLVRDTFEIFPDATLIDARLDTPRRGTPGDPADEDRADTDA